MVAMITMATIEPVGGEELDHVTSRRGSTTRAALRCGRRRRKSIRLRHEAEILSAAVGRVADGMTSTECANMREH